MKIGTDNTPNPPMPAPITLLPERSLGVDTIAGSASFIRAQTSLLVLHDGHLSGQAVSELLKLVPGAISFLDVRTGVPDIVACASPDTGILYACLQDDLGLPFVDAAYGRALKVQAVWYGQPRGYLSRNIQAVRALEAEFAAQQAAGYLKLDYNHGDVVNLIQAFEATQGRPGCIVEVGCFCGSSGGALLSYVRSRQAERGHPELHFHFMDVFEGFDYPAALTSSDSVWAGTHQTDGLEAVRQRLLAHGRDMPGLDIEVSRCNVITDPIPEKVRSLGVRLVNIDVDLYEAVAAGLARYAPLVVPGGMMISEDAGHTPLLIGALKAVEEFMASPAGKAFCRIDLRSGQTLLVKIGG